MESGHIRFLVAVDVQDFCQAVPDDGRQRVLYIAPIVVNLFDGVVSVFNAFVQAFDAYQETPVKKELESSRRIYLPADVLHQVGHLFVVVSRGNRFRCGVLAVLAEVVEGLVDIHGVAVEQYAHPEKPVAHIAVFFVGFVCGAGVFAENDHAGVHDIVLVEHAVVDKRPAVEKGVGRVAFFVSQSVGELQFGLVQVLGVFVDKKAVG